MKRFLWLYAVLCLVVPLQVKAAEVINNYDVRATIDKTGLVDITETITVTSENNQIRHGIYRDFPTSYSNGKGGTTTIPFIVKDIRRDGQKEPYHSEKLSNGVRLYIGNKDSYVSFGRHEYVIHYQTYNVVGFFTDHDEFYWNVTGLQWSFPILKAHILVEFPDAAIVNRYDAFTGYAGQQGKNFTARAYQNYFEAQTRVGLLPQQGLTIVAAIPKNIIAPPSVWRSLKASLEGNEGLFVFVSMSLLTLIFYVVVWYITGRDLPLAPIIPRFELMENVTPDLMRYVYKQEYDNKVFSAFLIDAAVQGKIKIDEGKEQVEITCIGSAVTETQKNVFAEMFLGTSLLLPTKRFFTIMDAWTKERRRELAAQMARIKAIHESQFLIDPAAFIALNAGKLGYTVGAGTMRPLLSKYLNYNPEGEYFATPPVAETGRIIVIGLSIAANFFLVSRDEDVSYTVAAVFFQIIVFFIFRQPLKKYSEEGQEIYEYAKGLKMYLSVAEKARLDKLYPKEITPEKFEQFLPYAIALDVEQQWCEHFDAYVASAGITYDTNRWYNGRYHRLSNLSSALNTAVVSSIASASTAPGSSSGLGGGGSSGGGGGGGGGGGW